MLMQQNSIRKITTLITEMYQSTNMSNPKNCTHIKVTGVRCGSPALREEQFCYFHQRMLRTVKGPPASRIHHAALLEDEESIQASLMEVVNALLRGTIELKRAELILRALNTAVRNIRRVNFAHASGMITQVPDYPAAPDAEVDEAARAEAARQATRAEIARVTARPPGTRKSANRRSRNGSCGDSRPRLSRRPRITGPQRTPSTKPTNAASRSHSPKATGARQKCTGPSVAQTTRVLQDDKSKSPL